MADGSIKVVSGMLDLDKDENGEEFIVLRGVLDHTSLERLKTDDYQREQLAVPKITRIIEGIRNRGIPDIVLGMRGERYLEKQGFFYLQDPVYIIDGYQRVTGALRMMAEGSSVPRIGMKLHFNTDYEFEKELFDKLNLEQTKLSGNVTLRNRRSTNAAMDVLYKLTTDKGFVMKDQICWGQNMRRGDLISGVTYVKVAAMLHSHAGPGRSSSVVELANGLLKIMNNVGQKKLVENVRVYFEIIDRCWGIRRVHYRGGATYLKSSFLVQLARVYSDHAVFWKDGLLVVDSSVQRKLSQFPISDPEVMRLSSTAGMAGELLYQLLVGHINSGRRTRRLIPRRTIRDRPLMADNGVEDEEDQ